MHAAGITERHRIHSAFEAKDRELLENAQVIVLSGGEVGVGWETFERTGMKEVILERYAQGAVLVGISAGAIQLGRQAIIETEGAFPKTLINAFTLVPALIDVHDEHDNWSRLTS